MQGLVFRHSFSFVFSFLLCFYIIPLLIKTAQQKGLLDKPDGKIKTHETPVPHLGGIAIFISFIATLALCYPFENHISWMLLGSTLLLFVGLIDDLHVLNPLQKFAGQVLAVLCFLKGGFSLKNMFFASSFLNFFLSGFWMLSVINAFNLVDVMDGLSSSIALVSATTFFFIALLFGQYDISLLLLAFIGALLAFFFYNKPPAKIYLGDAGAMFVGGFLAATPLLLSWSIQGNNAYHAPVIILAIPLIEIFSLVIIRIFKGIPFYQGSPHHFSIYLVKKGWSKYKVLVFTFFMGIALSLLSFLFLLGFFAWWGLMIGSLVFTIIWYAAVFYQPVKNKIEKIIVYPAVRSELHVPVKMECKK